MALVRTGARVAAVRSSTPSQAAIAAVTCRGHKRRRHRLGLRSRASRRRPVAYRSLPRRRAEPRRWRWPCGMAPPRASRWSRRFTPAAISDYHLAHAALAGFFTGGWAAPPTPGTSLRAGDRVWRRAGSGGSSSDAAADLPDRPRPGPPAHAQHFLAPQGMSDWRRSRSDWEMKGLEPFRGPPKGRTGSGDMQITQEQFWK